MSKIILYRFVQVKYKRIFHCWKNFKHALILGTTIRYKHKSVSTLSKEV